MPVVNSASHNTMIAPWWSHLTEAKADGRVTLSEVKKAIAPFQSHLAKGVDENYRDKVDALLGGDGVHVTKGAKAEIGKLLGVFTIKPHILGKPSYSPGNGAAMPSGGGAGPSVNLRADLSEGTARAVTNAWYKGNTLFVQVYGEAEHLTRMVDIPKDLSVSVPRPANPMGTYKLIIVDQNGKQLARGEDFSGMPPALPHP